MITLDQIKVGNLVRHNLGGVAVITSIKGNRIGLRNGGFSAEVHLSHIVEKLDWGLTPYAVKMIQSGKNISIKKLLNSEV